MDLPKNHEERHKRIMMEEDEVHPRWLMSLLTAPFYEACRTHNSEKCKYFCLDCNGPKATFCGSCYKQNDEHLGHRAFQVFKASNYPGIRSNTIEDFYDISDIHPYSINSEKIVYIKQRPKGNGSRNHYILSKKCQKCGRELPSQVDKYKFCSIGCKLLHNKGEKLEPEEDEQTRRKKYPFLNLNLNLRRRSRKGKPQRAPFY